VKILIANLGSTSFKYKLFDLSISEKHLAEGSVDRIGLPESTWSFIAKCSEKNASGQAHFNSHSEAIDFHLQHLIEEGVVDNTGQIDAIGFKAVHGGPISGAVLVDDEVIKVMEDFSDVAPLHNPPYIQAMKAFRKKLPKTPQVASFETAFHQTIPQKRQVYAIPYEWTEDLGIRRYGFHGASHCYIGQRIKEIEDGLTKIINCHLGGSSSICAIENGQSIANSFGMTAQSGIPHAVRIGDFDTFSLLKLKAAGLDQDTIWKKLGKESGLLGMSGVSSDLRDIEKAAEQGNQRAELAVEVLVESIRFYIGSYLVALNGADAICFTGGIGQFSSNIREKVLENMDFAGIKLDLDKNREIDGKQENRIDQIDSKVQIWVIPTNEELIVARQTLTVLTH
jgi:acetate kinase